MNKIKARISGKGGSKLQVVKYVKEFSGLGLKEAKALCDYAWGTATPMEIEIDKSESEEVKRAFEDLGMSVVMNDRERKMKRILYADQAMCVKDMLTDVAKWDTLDIITNEDKENLTYNQCREKAIEIIFDRYSEYLKGDQFLQLFSEIAKINEKETKPIEVKFIKFNEEFDEMCSEFLKLKGYTYKSYDKEELMSEMADTLQVLLSIYSDIEKETGIYISDVIERVKEKNVKWLNKIQDYNE